MDGRFGSWIAALVLGRVPLELPLEREVVLVEWRTLKAPLERRRVPPELPMDLDMVVVTWRSLGEAREIDRVPLGLPLDSVVVVEWRSVKAALKLGREPLASPLDLDVVVVRWRPTGALMCRWGEKSSLLAAWDRLEELFDGAFLLVGRKKSINEDDLVDLVRPDVGKLGPVIREMGLCCDLPERPTRKILIVEGGDSNSVVT